VRGLGLIGPADHGASAVRSGPFPVLDVGRNLFGDGVWEVVNPARVVRIGVWRS
jgi:hypothetical protein